MVAVVVMLLCAAQAGWAQLSENCTVSVLNRTVRVNPDGSWVLPNIPANFGQVKARATCVENGVTRSGESEFFTIPANGVINLPVIVLGATTQVPSSLAVSPAVLSLDVVGQTRQLTVTATYPNNSNRNVTAASAGTNYTTSNPAIASVSPGGLVMAVASGTVVIQATNDGASAIITVSVVLSTLDSDGDGIPDEAEVSLGLDPQNPVDAQEDFDRDNLTNLQEFQLGTNLRSADTDGDNINDGEEAIPGADGFITNPLLPDTDGDGVRDGLEVQTGTDPTNPNSFNLARALSRIEVSPNNLVLTVNTIIGVASRQLTVTGRMLDGFTIDLTSTQRGTNYSSNNLGICNFGAPDGRVFAGTAGTCTVTVTNSGFSAAAIVVVRTFAPAALASINIPGYANNVDVSGSYAYVAAGATGLQVVDVSNPRAPVIVGSANTPGNANDVRVVGNLAYVADGSAGLQIIDISTPAAPAIVGSVDTPGEAQDVIIAGGRAYVADGATGLQVIDVTTPAAPRILGAVDTAGTARGVDISGGFAVVADDSPSNALRVVDVTNPASPQIVGNVALPGSAKDLRVSGTTAYVAVFTGGFQVVDFSTPTTPRIIGGLPGSGQNGFVPRDVDLSGQFALAAEQLFPNVVPIIDISNPAAPNFRATLDFAPLGDYAGTGIAVTQQFVYMTGESFIVTVENGVNGNTRLFIGQYLSLEDLAGVAPTVSITAPANGSTAIEGTTIPFTVSATDDVAVAAVNFLVNNQVVFTDTAAPYEFSLTAPTGTPALTLGATAIDFGGNIGTAANVVVSVIPDPLTTAAGRVVDKDGNNVSGAAVTCLGQSGTSAADGTFSVPGLSTLAGDIRCVATFVSGGLTLTGVSAAVSPVRGGITNVGDIVLRSVTSRGRDFWIAHQAELSPGAQIFILADATANYTITAPNLNVMGVAGPQSPAVVAVPSILEIRTNQIVENKGIHITSDADITVLFFYSGGASSDVYLAIPTPHLGSEYIAVGFQESVSARGFSGTQAPSEFVIVAGQNNTSVTVETNCRSLSGTEAGSSLNVVLNAGQTYQYQCGNGGDVTGSRIVSDRPVGVIAGSQCSDVPTTVAACDVLSEMMFPVSSLYGTEFYTAPLPGNAPDLYRVMAASDGTTVNITQNNTTTTHNLNRGQFREVRFKAGARFTSNKPVSVTQYAVGNAQAGIGDPFQMQIVPTTAYRESFRLFTPSGFGQGTFAIITAPNSAVPSVTLNGAAVTGFQPLPGGTHQFRVIAVPSGQSLITASGPVAVYGIGFTGFASYGYPAGF
jgi:hypothetical protein